MLDEWRGKLRFFAGLRGFLARPLNPEQAREMIRQELARRNDSFLRLVDLGVYQNPRSPFKKLLNHAHVSFDELESLVRQVGIRNATSRLYDEGVFVAYEEWRGSVPVKRGSLEFMIRETDVDNPLLASQYEVGSSGSRSAGSRAFMDLTLLGHESAYRSLVAEAHGIENASIALWRPVAPSSSGLNNVLRYAKVGHTTERWFSQVPFPSGAAGRRARLLVRYTQLVGRLGGMRLPWPEHVPQDRTEPVLSWLAEMKAAGRTALLDTAASAATRICLDAMSKGIDIAGTVFEVGSEPFTPAKAKVLDAAGARAIDRYSASDLGTAALGCANPSTIDDMHVVTDKLEVISRSKTVDENGAIVPALVYTSVHPSCRKVMINAESGDYGQLEERDCGCAIGEVGFRTHLTGLYGYDKLTSEGVTFMGTELFSLVEEVLPARFGGNPTDYQLVEEEDEHGLPMVNVVIAPGVGVVNETAVVEAVLIALKGYDRYSRGALMAQIWDQGRTLRVVRRQPYLAGGRKVMPLHMLQTRR